MRGRMYTIIWAWREVVKRNKGEWGMTTRIKHERTHDGPDWLMPKEVMVDAWAARGGISAIHHGSMGAWLMAYVRARANDKT